MLGTTWSEYFSIVFLLTQIVLLPNLVILQIKPQSSYESLLIKWNNTHRCVSPSQNLVMTKFSGIHWVKIPRIPYWNFVTLETSFKLSSSPHNCKFGDYCFDLKSNSIEIKVPNTLQNMQGRTKTNHYSQRNPNEV